jgi:hypothetical protein
LFPIPSAQFFATLRAQRPLTTHLGTIAEPVSAFAFCLDGDHHAPAAEADLNNCIAFTHPGTHILMDDTELTSPLPSAQVARRAEKWPTLRLVTRNPHALFVRC